MATFTNQAVLSYNGITTSSNVATGEIVEVLSASKDVLSSEYGTGDTVAYVINIVNSGNAPFTALTVTDDLGAYTYQPDTGTERTLYPLTYVDGSIRCYQNGVEQAAPAVTQTGGIRISGIGVPAGGSTTLVYQARTNAFADPQIGQKKARRRGQDMFLPASGFPGKNTGRLLFRPTPVSARTL